MKSVYEFNSEEFDEKSKEFLKKKGIDLYNSESNSDGLVEKILNVILKEILNKKAPNQIKETQENKNTKEEPKKIEDKDPNLIEPDKMELDTIYSSEDLVYKPLNISQTKLREKGTETICFMTICSSVASVAHYNKENPNNDTEDRDKEDLIYSQRDAQKFKDFIEN